MRLLRPISPIGDPSGCSYLHSHNECRIAPRGPSLAAAPGLATVGAGVIARSPRRGSGGATSRRATFAQPMILKEPNTVKLRLSAPTSNTVNIVLMLTSVLGYILLCSMPTAPYGDRGGGLGVNPLRLTPTLNTTEQTVHPRPDRFNLFNKALRRPVPRPDQPCQRVQTFLPG